MVGGSSPPARTIWERLVGGSNCAKDGERTQQISFNILQICFLWVRFPQLPKKAVKTEYGEVAQLVEYQT